MNKHIIRTSETDNVKGLPSTQHIDVFLEQKTKTLPLPNVSTVLSQRSVYEEERQAGNNFRLILTVTPYCSNVLFNPLTEIVKNEGSEDVRVITDMTNMEGAPFTDKLKIENTIGTETPTRVHMICNTEYSSEIHGNYEYHPGYDFFDNHLLRNKSFKIVNPIDSGATDAKEVFNTLKDYARDRNSTIKKYVQRLSINSINNKQGFNLDKHLYITDDILKIEESINNNLYEDNGWWGFGNNTTIDSKKLTHRKWETMDIGKSLNNHKACEFIDMYPDRSLFSFSPKFNKYTHENEYNWKVVLTYPYKNIYNHPLCLGGPSYIKLTSDSDGNSIEETVSEGNRWTGLKIMTAQLGSGKVGGSNLVFRTYTKHGLSQGDVFYLYYTNPYMGNDENYAQCGKFKENTLNGNEIYYETQIYYRVSNVGDLSKNNNDYYFYTSNLSLLKEIYESYLRYVEKLLKQGVGTDKIPLYSDYEDDDKKDIYDEDNNLKTTFLNKILRYSNFRVRRCVKGVKSNYYIRQFRKIPNLRGAEREMTEEEAMHHSKFNGVFEAYIADNALDPSNPNFQRDFNSEIYQLGFASNIYNDNITQITFTDGINVKGLCDNLGRPLSEIYYTIIKNNAGNEVWYNNTEPLYTNKSLLKYKDAKDKFKEKYGVDYDNYKIEFSHCFSKVTSGFEMFVNADDSESAIGPIDYWKKLSSVRHIANIINKGVNGGSTPIVPDDISIPLEDNIKDTDTFFYGDLVEFNGVEFQEKTLSKVMHRFNTAQRETQNNPFYSQYQYHEITEDDYDPVMIKGKPAFEVKEFSAVNGIQDEDTDKAMTVSYSARKQKDYATISRPEGYYYQAHYPIKIKEFTDLMQGSHYSLRVREANPVQKDGILIQIKTLIKHNLSINDIILVCDDESDVRYITKCVGIIDSFTFLMSPNYDEYIINATDFEDYEHVYNLKDSVFQTEDADKNKNRYKQRFSWLELCQILNGDFDDDISYPNLVLRRKNNEIPEYATYVGNNQYLWRDIINIGDSRIKEIDDYIFANGYFYITQKINFYLKRQDPFGNNGLYFDGDDKYPFFPNDPSGIQQGENNYISKDTEVLC